MIEAWKDIEGYEGHYEVSTFGRVRNKRTGRVLKEGTYYNGYSKITLSKNSVTKTYLVHRLIAQAFIPNPENKPQVNHKDENKTNNHADNLEWMTAEENVNYGTRNDRVAKAKGKPVSQWTLDGKFVACFPSAAYAEQYCGIGKNEVARVANGKRKTAHGYIWRYEELHN